MARIEANNPPGAEMVGDTHDEIIAEVDEDRVDGLPCPFER